MFKSKKEKIYEKIIFLYGINSSREFDKCFKETCDQNCKDLWRDNNNVYHCYHYDTSQEIQELMEKVLPENIKSDLTYEQRIKWIRHQLNYK